MLCLGRILTSKSLTQKRGRAATVAALDLRACSAAEGRQHSAGACASAVPAAAGRRSACSRLAAGGAGSPRVEAPAAAEPAGRGAAGHQRGLRHRRAAAPVAAAPTGKNPAGAAASEAAPPAGAASPAELPAVAAAPEWGAHPQRQRRQRACRLQARAVPSPRRTGAAGRVAAAAAAEGELGFWAKRQFCPYEFDKFQFLSFVQITKIPLGIEKFPIYP